MSRWAICSSGRRPSSASSLAVQGRQAGLEHADTKGGAAAPDGASRASKPAGQFSVRHRADEQVFRAGVPPALAVWILDRRDTEGYAALGNRQRAAFKFPGDESIWLRAQQRQLVRGPGLRRDPPQTRNAQGNAPGADLLCRSTGATGELVVGHLPELTEFALRPRGAPSSFGFASFDGSFLPHRAAGQQHEIMWKGFGSSDGGRCARPLWIAEHPKCAMRS